MSYFATIIVSLLLATSISCSAVLGTRIDCYPIAGATKEKCESLGCIWSPLNETQLLRDVDKFYGQPLPAGGGAAPRLRVNAPWCYFPDDYVGYEVLSSESIEDSGRHQIKLRRTRASALEEDVQVLEVDIEQHNQGDILRIRVYDPDTKRFEPKLPKLNLSDSKEPVADSKKKVDKFLVEIKPPNRNDTNRPAKPYELANLVVSRKSTGAVIFSTDLRKLIFADRFIQLTSGLDSPFVFGLGEHYDTFLKWVNSYKVYSFYNTDMLPLAGGTRSYGGFPFYVNLDSDNQANAHGVYLKNSNAMDIILHPEKSVTFRPIGGVLDFYLFIGPTPNDVVAQYQRLVGLPDMPPRWALGFHLCRYNYGSLEKTRLVWQRTRDAGIPFDIQWNDIDYMHNYNDFTYDPIKFSGLPLFVNELHANKMHYMILFDPGLSQEDNYFPYRLGEELGIFVKNATNQTLVGKVWNSSGRTVFPDFSNPKSLDYWRQLFVKFHAELEFDGAWIDMNDISSFVDGSLDGCPWKSSLEQPPYVPGEYNLQRHSLCLSAQHMDGAEYDLHNLYSFYEAIATRQALVAARGPNKRPLIISRSTSPGQGHYGGHWSGDVKSNWDYLKWSIPSLLEHSMYGFSLMGSDICGFVGNTTPELCARWSTLGAFYTFTRNHNDDVSIDQDPVALGPEVVSANKNALTKRYSLLPYLYTLMRRASQFGEPVARAVPFEFFDDPESARVEYQFLWGKAIMFSPIVDAETYIKRTFLPKGRWYETDILPDKSADQPRVPKLIDSTGGWASWYETRSISLTNLPVFYRGGHVVPVYSSVQRTIAETIEKSQIGLEVALCQMGRAHGELYLDDGETLDLTQYNLYTFAFENDTLAIALAEKNTTESAQFGPVKVFGVQKRVKSVEMKQGGSSASLEFHQFDHLLRFDLDHAQVSSANLPISVKLSYAA